MSLSEILPSKVSSSEKSRPGGKASEQGIVFAGLLGLAILYVCLAHFLNGFHAFWSPDSGARFGMIQNGLRHGSLLSLTSLTALTYDGAASDPAGRLHPLHNYLFAGPKGLTITFPPLFPWLCGLAYRAWGFGGLLVAPLLSGVAAVWVTYKTAERLGLRCRAALPLVMGLATPLVIYSVVFWDHSLIMLMAAGTGYCLLRAQDREERDGRRLLFAALASALLGAGLWVQELFLFLFAAVLLASLPWGKTKSGRRLLLGLTASFSLFLVLWLVGNQALYGFWGGAHLMTSVHFLSNVGHDHPGHIDLAHDYLGQGKGGQAGEYGTGLRQGLVPREIAGRALFQLVGSKPGNHLGSLFLILIGLIPLARLLGRRAVFVWPPLALAAAVAALGLVHDGRPQSGLFPVTPLLIPALAAPWSGGREDAGRHAGSYAWMGRVCGLFALLIFLNPVPPGLNWGSRYLLTVLPYLVLLSARALEGPWLPARGRRRGAATLGLVGLALIGISGVCQVRGFAAVRDALRDNGKLNRMAGALPTPALVTDVRWLGPQLTPSALPPMFLVDPGRDLPLLLSVLRRQGAASFTFMGTPAGGDALAQAVLRAGAPFRPVAARQEDGTQFVRFAPPPAVRLPKRK